jgi:uncharacterized protein YraI
VYDLEQRLVLYCDKAREQQRYKGNNASGASELAGSLQAARPTIKVAVVSHSTVSFYSAAPVDLRSGPSTAHSRSRFQPRG